jgi:hypothetical protein
VRRRRACGPVGGAWPTERHPLTCRSTPQSDEPKKADFVLAGSGGKNIKILLQPLLLVWARPSGLANLVVRYADQLAVVPNSAHRHGAMFGGLTVAGP